jgi:hypothetical protein
MSADDTVNVDNVSVMRLLRPRGEPGFVILRVETRDGKNFNFGMDRDAFSHAVDVWRFDLDAVASALQSGAPDPGKPFGSSDDRKAS